MPALPFDLTVTDKIAHIRLNRPDDLNSFTPALWRELPRCVQRIDREAAARVIVVSSTGRHFTAGMDLAAFASLGPGGGDAGTEPGRANAALMRTVSALQDTFTCLERARMPVIAAVQGGCIGAGVDLISACDLRFASRDAFFCIHEINLAMTADVGTFPRLQRLIPEGIARELAYTGNRLDAARAERIGLVNGVADDHAALMEQVLAMARQIAEKSPLAVWGSKEMLNYGRDHSTADSLNHVATWQAGMLQSAEIGKAIAAQQNKTTAAFDDLPRDRETG